MSFEKKDIYHISHLKIVFIISARNLFIWDILVEKFFEGWFSWTLVNKPCFFCVTLGYLLNLVFTNGPGDWCSIPGWVIQWYKMPPCLTLSIIRYRSRVKWSNQGNRVAHSPTPWCCSYWKGAFGLPTVLTYLWHKAGCIVHTVRIKVPSYFLPV